MEAENSENQAKLLMNAFKSPSGINSSSSFGLLGSYSSNSQADKERFNDFERQISELTNETLQLKEENQILQGKLQETQGKLKPEEVKAQIEEDSESDE